MKRFTLYTTLSFLLPLFSFGQASENLKDIRVYTSPMGNYLQVVTDEDMSKEPSLMKNLDHFEVKRMVFRGQAEKAKEKDFKSIGKLKKAMTKGELKSAYPNGMFEEIQNLYQLSTEDSLVDFYTSHDRLGDFPLINTRIETQQALGYVFLDDDVKKGDVCYYKIDRVNKDNQRSTWGYGVVHSGVGNYLLDQIHFDWVETNATDSAVHIKWQYDVSKIPTPTEVEDGDIFDPTKAKYFTGHYIHSFNIDAKVVSYENGSWVQQEVLKPTLDSTGQFLTFSWYTDASPEDVISAYLIPQDFVYNEGLPSDTALAIATDNSQVTYIYGINVVDTTNGIYISWEELPRKPYYSGIEVARYDENDSLKVLTVLPSSDTVYIDRHILPGIHYRYSVRPLFVPLQNLEQDIGASGVGTYTRFDNPLPAFELAATNIQRDIKLSWNNYDEVSIYGFYVYRGTSPKSMSIIAGPIKDSIYMDTVGSLNGRSQYYYSIAAQNLAQDTSAFSNTVVIKPQRNEIIAPPSYIKFYYANGKLKVLWDDPRQDDNYIQGYSLERKIDGESSFKVVTPIGYSNNSFQDEIGEDAKAIYRVRSISWDSTMGEYSPEFTFRHSVEFTEIIDVFSLRNVSGGIQISLPKAVHDDRVGYTIYKREISQESFTELKRLSNTQFVHVDGNVQDGKLYVYAIAIRSKNGKVGDKGREVSLRRKSIRIK